MDLNSSKDKTLLKNCMILKLKQLNIDLDNQINNSGSSEKIQDIENDISYYSNIYEILKNDDSETLIATLKDSTEDEKYSKFSNTILLSSPQEVANEYIDLVKSLMLENNVYSDEKFKELQTAFFKGNEELLEIDKSKKSEEFEEEQKEETFYYLTPEIESILDNLDRNLKKCNSQTITGQEFRNFANEFKEILKKLGIEKFGPYFKEKNKKIANMEIFEEQTPETLPVYKTDLTILDSESQEEHFFIQEPTKKSMNFENFTFYQIFCHLYVESKNCSKIDEALLNNEIIKEKLNSFKLAYPTLKEQSKYGITFGKDNKIIPCDTYTQPEVEQELNTSKLPSIPDGDEPDL